MPRARHETCPLCEAWFTLADGRFPRHRGIKDPICQCSEKTLAEAEEIEHRNNQED